MAAAGASRTLRGLLTAVLAATTLVLTGCALPRMIDSEVESFVGPDGARTGVGFRFERLPSQQGSARQDTLERMAEQALVEAGLHRSDSDARYTAQVELAVHTIASPMPQRSREPRVIVRTDGTVVVPPPLLVLETPWYSHTVRVVLRERDQARVAFESTASFDGPWSDSHALVPVLLRAALRDYPQPPSGLRKVVIELPAPGRSDTP